MENGPLAARTASQPFPLGKLLALSLENWHWFLISALTAASSAFIYLRYTTPTYKIKASILVRDDTKGSDFGEAIGIQGLDLPIGKSNVDNEVEVLRSRSLAEDVVKELQLYVTYFSAGDVKTSEIYEQRPVTMHFTKLNNTVLKKEFEKYEVLLHKNKGFTLVQSTRQWVGHFGDMLNLPQGQAVLLRTHAPFVPENKYSIIVSPTARSTRNYQKSLSVTPANKMVSMINLSWTDILPEKGEAILAHHLKTYLRNSIEDKTRIADSTIAFIDKNLGSVMTEMRDIEQEMTRFRKKHHLADLPESGRTLIQNHGKIRQELSDNDVQLEIIHSLQDYLLRHPREIVPASLVLSEVGFSDLIKKYNELLTQRTASLRDRTAEHPYILKLDAQIPQLAAGIKSGIEQYLHAAMVRSIALKEQESSSLAQMDQIPHKQVVMTDYARQQQIREELYLFLARKRLETSLSRSSTQGNGRIIDSAKADAVPYNPNKSITLLVALLLGLGIPTAAIYLRHIGDERIWYKTEIQNLTSAPVLARIGHAPGLKKNELPKVLLPRLSEQFRLLRTGLLNPESKVIMVTSGADCEGKSFVAINLVHAFALGGKRTLLLDLNLRKPVVASHFGLQNIGVADFLSSKNEHEVFIQSVKESTQLDIIAAGNTYENPADLLLNPKLKILTENLSKNYDHIIIDTPPINVMADTFILAPVANVTLLVVRKRLTNRAFLLSVQNWIDHQKLPGVSLVLNDFDEVSDQQYSVA